MSKQWYPRYVGDYMRDTGHLTLAEHGAYGRLLDYYYASGNPLPPDLPALYRVCCAMMPEEQNAVEKVANEFFAVNGDGLRHNSRADRELLRMQDQHERLSEAGRNGGLASAQARLKPGRKPGHKPGSSISTTTTTTTGEQPQPDPPISHKGDCELFWDAYPRKTGKKAAEKAWHTAKDRPPIETILSAIEVQKRTEQWTRDGGQFIPHPATWINQGRWDDQPIQKVRNLGGIKDE